MSFSIDLLGAERLASIPGAVIQLRQALLAGSAYGRDLGRYQQLPISP